MADWAAIEAELDALLAAEGYELVQLETVRGKAARLVVLADHRDAPGTITLDDCAELSRRISSYLDVVDPFGGPFRLMVSSPGVNRPLTRLEHCARFVGRLARIRHRREGQPRTDTGRLDGVAGDEVQLVVGERTLLIPWATVEKAHLVYEWEDEQPESSRRGEELT